MADGNLGPELIFSAITWWCIMGGQLKMNSDLRRLSTGEMIYKSQLASSIASIITGCFNESNSESILVYDSQLGCPQN